MIDAWTRRRRAVAEEEARLVERNRAIAEDAALAGTPEGTPEGTTGDRRSEAEILQSLGLPAPEETEDRDLVRQLLGHDLPHYLRRRALRRLWRLDPVLANLDGLVDYGEDYTDQSLCARAVETVYTVGKGMWRAAEGEAEVENAVAAEATPDEVVKDETLPAGETPPVRAAQDVAAQELEADPETVQMPAFRQRMRFSYDAEAV